MEVFQAQKKILSYCGLERFPSNRMKNVFKMLKTWNFLVMFYCVFSSALFAFNTQDISDIAESMATGTTAFIMFIKYAVFCNQADGIFEVMDEIEELNEKYKSLPNASEILSKANKLSITITNLIKFACFNTVILYVTKPLLTDFVNYYFYDKQPSRNVPIKAQHLYDVTQSPAYELTYLLQSYAIAFVASYVVVMSLNFSTFCLNISAHFDILRVSICDMKLKEFVQYHLKLISITHRLNSIYEPMIFAQFFIETILFVTSGLNVIAADNFLKILASIFHTSGAMADVAVYSFGSQRILDSSLSICDEAYNIDKGYVLVIMVAQKKLRFTTRFFEASFDTYSIMLSRTWSFITLLKSFIK